MLLFSCLQIVDSERRAHSSVADVERSVLVVVPAQREAVLHGQRLSCVRLDDEPVHCKVTKAETRLPAVLSVTKYM